MLPPRLREHALEFLTQDGLRLVGRAHEPAPSRGRAVICHPHPLYGGTMDNKVVTTATRAAAAAGLATLRFDFRGVGRSEGEHGGGELEVEDVRAALEVHAGLHPGMVALIGFSFGATVCARTVARGQAADALVLLGLPLGVMQVPRPPLPTAGLLVVVGDGDDFCPVARAQEFVDSYASPAARLVVVQRADHFFGGQLAQVAQAVCDALGPCAAA